MIGLFLKSDQAMPVTLLHTFRSIYRFRTWWFTSYYVRIGCPDLIRSTHFVWLSADSAFRAREPVRHCGRVFMGPLGHGSVGESCVAYVTTTSRSYYTILF